MTVDARTGQVLAGRYRILRRIGEGGMGAVFEAERVDGGKRVAIKTLHAHLANDQEIVARFKREAIAAASIGDPHIVAVWDSGKLEDGTHFLALEYLEGRDLAKEIREGGPLTVGRTVHIAAQICDALTAAHAKGIVHRDLKPENVFLIQRGEDRDFVKVVDFGVSKFRDAADHGISTPSHTRTGTALGTPYYMAPEQAQGLKDVDHRADVYALGVILFRALTGEHPFDDESYPMLILKICTEAPPPVRKYRADVTAELDAVVQKMLCKDKQDRFPDAAAAKTSLAPFRGVLDEPQLTGAPGTASTRALALGLAATTPATPVAAPGSPGAPAGPAAPPAIGDGEDDDEPAGAVPAPRGGSRAPLLLLGGLGAALAIGAVIMLATHEPDGPVDPVSTLPEPQPPEARPLVAPGSGGIGWTWVNPLPRAMPSWYAVDAVAPRLIALVGRSGAAARFRDGSLMVWPTGTDASLNGVAWSSPSEAIAVGDRGTILVLGTGAAAATPRVIASGATQALRGVVARTPTEAIVVGDAGTLLRLRAYEADRLESGTDAALLGVHLRGETVWIAGERGTILKLENGRVSAEASGTQSTLRAIGGCARGDLYAAGDDGRLLRRLEDGSWSRIETPRRDPWAAIACDGDRVVVAGLRGGMLLAQRSEVVELPTGTDRAWYGASAPPGGAGGSTWVVGADGRLAQVASNRLRTLTGGPTAPIRDLGELGGALVAVGEYGRILRERETGLVEGRTPTKSALAGLANLSQREVVAVGDFGAVVRIAHDGARLIPSPAGSSWRDVVTDGSEVLAVGTNGAILRGTIEALRASRNEELGDLWGLAGTPADALAVGTGGVILRIDAQRSTRVACEATANLRGVVRIGETAWAVGENGTILRIEARGCTEERTGGPHLNGIGIGPEGRPLAVGDRGVSLERTATGAWQPTSLDVGQTNLRTVTRLERYVYIAGAGGLIVRHIVLDGT